MTFDIKNNATTSNPDPVEPTKPPERADIKSFADLDLGKEMLKQYNRAVYLFEVAEFDDESSPSQKATVLNSIRAIQEQILRSLERLHNVEKLKLIETTLVDVLKQFPEVRAAFLEAYETAGKEAENRGKGDRS